MMEKIGDVRMGVVVEMGLVMGMGMWQKWRL